MAKYCEMELVKRLQTVKQGFTLQLDESTDVSGLATLLVFVRYTVTDKIVSMITTWKLNKQ